MAMIDCPECKARISDFAHTCPHCGRPSTLGKLPAIRVNDIDMKFGTMVGLMVQAAIAAIPAALILLAFGGIAFALIGAMFHR